MPHKKINKLYGNPKPKGKNEQETKQASLDEKAFLLEARERARDGATYWKDNWDAAEDDLKFLAGEQWPSQVRTERELEQRPCLTNNVLPTFVDQILGDQRQNKPSIKVSAVDHVQVENQQGAQEELKIPNQAGSKDYSLGEAFTGVIKNIEYNCDAETAYDNAFQASVESGMGYLRVLTDYTDQEGMNKEALIKCIENQFAVIMDPDAKENDYHDMGWCFVDDLMNKKKFQKEYPNATADPINEADYGDMGAWFTDRSVRISEYFIRKPVNREAAQLSDGRFVFIDEIEPIIDELIESGITIVKTRTIKTYKVLWHKITGHNILEGPIEIDCTYIPVVPVWGKKITIKKKVIYRSAIRHSKDAQRMANYWDSAGTEAVALAPKAPFIGMEGHTEGREDEWKTANTKNHGMLTYIPQFQNDPGPRREQPAAIPAAEITLGMNSTDKIKSTLGMFDASIGAAGNETSGKAILARQREADVGSFTFIDNLSKAIARVGKILVEIIPKTYDTERLMRLKFSDDTEDFVVLNQQVFDDETQEWVTVHDLGVAKYDVVVKTGPAYTTQRQEAAEAMLQFATAVPSAAAVMADLIAQNMDWPGSDDITARLKKIIPPDVLSSKEREELQEDQPEPPPPTPEQELQMKELETRDKESEAKVAQAEADIAEAQADTFKAQLETDDAKAQLAAIESGAEGGDAAYQQVRELVATAIAEMMAKDSA